MMNNIKFMLLGIFLAVMSVGGFFIADEIEIFLIIAIALPILAVWAFAKGFIGNDEENKSDSTEEVPPVMALSESTTIK